MKVTFELKESGYLSINAREKKYGPLERISNFDWTSERAEEDLDWAEKCKAGTFVDENGDTDYYVGFEGSPGIIWVRNGDRAYVEAAPWRTEESLLILELDELIDFLKQLRDFLKSVGK